MQGAPQSERAALAAVAAQFWVNGMIYAAIIPRLPDIRDRLSLEISTLGLILTLSAVGGLVGSGLGGPAIARFGTKRCIVVGSVIAIGVLPIVGLAPSVAVLVLSLGVLAMADVVVDIAMNMQGSWLSARRTVPVMNRLHGLWSLGTVVGGLVAVQAAAAGVAIWVHLAGVAAVLGLTLLVSARHLLGTDTDINTEGDVARSEPDTGGGTEAERASRSQAGLVSILGLGVLGGAAVTMELTTSDWAAFRLADDLGVSPGRAGLGFVAFTAGMVTGRFLGDTIQSAVGPRVLVRGAALLAAVGLALATVTPTTWYDGIAFLNPSLVTLAGYYLAALGVSVIFPHLYDAAAKAPGPVGRGLAALTAGTRIAGLSAPVFVGFVADTSLSVGAAVALATIPCCLLVFLVGVDK